MKIATWNVERLKHKKALDEILLELAKRKADILVLTETDRQLKPEYRYCFDTPLMAVNQPGFYAPTENRVSIFTNYPCIRQHPTYDENTALCVELETERGNLLVYGTIIGVYGNRHPSFVPDLKQQMKDIDRFSKLGNLCFCGDFNCSFADNYYFTNAGRDAILTGLQTNRLSLLTKDQPECIDHITVTRDFVRDASVQIEEWNLDRRLSDHKGVAVSF